MSLYSRLFKRPKPEPTNSRPPQPQPKAPAADPQQMDFSEPLQKLAMDASDSKQQGLARRRIAELLDTGELDLTALKSAFDDTAVLLAIVSLSQQQALQQQLLADITDQQSLYQLATEGATARLRQLAAARVEQRELLELLLKHSKGRDKAVYKLVKQRFDGFRADDKRAAERAAQLQTLCGELEKLSQHPNEPQFQPRLQHYKQQWASLKQHADSDTTAIEAALAACQQIVDAAAQTLADADAHRQAVAAADDNRHQLLSRLQSLIAEVYGASEIEADFERDVLAQLSDCQQQWLALAELSAPLAAEENKFKQHCSALESLLTQLKTHGGLLKQMASLPATSDELRVQITTDLSACLSAAELISEAERGTLLQQALAVVADYRQQQRTTAANRAQAESALSGLIRRGKAAVEQGQMKQASGIARAIEEKLELIDKLPAQLEKHLATFQQSLDKIRDWQRYAVMPKLEAVVAQMEQLVEVSLKSSANSTIPADALAVKIRKLQDEWKSLSQGGGDQYQELWQRFHDAAQKAYQPCKVYFDELAKQRALNLQHRQQLLTQLQTFERDNDWESADWKALENLLRAAKQQWRDFSPVEHNANKPLQKNFDAVLDQLHGKLDSEYQRNIERKQQLVDRAEQALSKDDAFAAIDEVKALQPQWKSIGVTRRRDDQKLWQQFRQHCDAVFERRQQLSDAFKAELNEQQQRAQLLITQLQALFSLEGEALLAARSTRDELHDAFVELGELPKAAVKKIRDQFHDALQQFEDAIDAHHKKQQQQRWLDLFAAADAVRRCELAAASEATVAEAQSLIDAIALWPKNGETAIKERLANAARELDAVANEQALRELCIRMEILTGLDSPDEDKAARMAYQVTRLQKGMGQSASVDNTENLMLAWVAVTAVEDALYATLFERFNAASA